MGLSPINRVIHGAANAVTTKKSATNPEKKATRLLRRRSQAIFAGERIASTSVVATAVRYFAASLAARRVACSAGFGTGTAASRR